MSETHHGIGGINHADPGTGLGRVFFVGGPKFFFKRLPLFRNRFLLEPFPGQKKFLAPLAREVKNDL